MASPNAPEELRRKVRAALGAHRRTPLQKTAVPAAVLLPLVPLPEGYAILFTKRTENLRHHRGEICFPGGAVQPEDETPLAAALRETEEEIGLPPGEVEILGVLDDVHSVHGYLVTPYVGVIPYGFPYAPNEAEIERVFTVPVALLQDPAIFREESWVRAGERVPVYFYTCGDDVIWGLTARILKQFLELAGEPFRLYTPPDFSL